MLQDLPPPVHRRAAKDPDTRQAGNLGASVRRGAVAVAAVTVTGGFLAVTSTPGPTPAPGLTAFPADLTTAPAAGRDAAAAMVAPVVPAAPSAVAPTSVAPAPAPTTAPSSAAPSSAAPTSPATATSAPRPKVPPKPAAAAAAKPAAKPAAAPAGCKPDTSQLGRVKANVRQAAELIGCRYDPSAMYGVASRGNPSDHPRGLAVDFIPQANGDAIAACVLRNTDALNVSYVIWRQRINFGNGWEAMENRGGATANHENNVHVSFKPNSGGAAPKC